MIIKKNSEFLPVLPVKKQTNKKNLPKPAKLKDPGGVVRSIYQEFSDIAAYGRRQRGAAIQENAVPAETETVGAQTISFSTGSYEIGTSSFGVQPAYFIDGATRPVINNTDE